MTTGKTFQARLKKPEIVTAPGIYDALSALLAEKAGFEAIFLSGSSIAYTQLGRPDVGLVTMNEVAELCRRITDRVKIPVLVDVDSGFGNAANAARTIRVMEQAGAAAIQIEDQLPVKPASDLRSRPLVPSAEMVSKIKALTDSRRSSDTLISARSDSPASEPMSQTLERVGLYCEAGADLVFVEGLSNLDEVRAVVETAGKTPVVFNLLHAGRAISDASQLQNTGVSIALFPGNAVLSAADAMREAFKALRDHPALPEAGFKLSPQGLNDLLDAPALLAHYEASRS